MHVLSRGLTNSIELGATHMVKELTGKTSTTANGHLSYGIYRAKPEFVIMLGQLLQSEFGFLPVGRPVVGLSEVVAEIELPGVKLGLGWDNCTGAYVMAFCEEGDNFIKRIADYLDGEIELPKYRKYVDGQGD